MKPERIPLIGQVIESGADDRIFDTLMLAGPLVVVLPALVGRNLFTEALAAAYLAVFVGYVLYIGLAR